MHRTKLHVSVFLKHDGNMDFYVSVTFTCCGNVKIQFYVRISRFRHVSGTEMPMHVSVMFMSADFYCCLFPLRFCKRISAVVCFRYVSANEFLLLFVSVTFLQTDFQCVCCIIGKFRHEMVLYTLFQNGSKYIILLSLTLNASIASAEFKRTIGLKRGTEGQVRCMNFLSESKPISVSLELF